HSRDLQCRSIRRLLGNHCLRLDPGGAKSRSLAFLRRNACAAHAWRFQPVKLSFSDVNLNLRQFDGPLTRELVLEPSEFGLAHFPVHQKADSIMRTVCGYCSTGCALNVHLRDGHAVNLTADPEYSVNLGMACPKGWEALTPLGA